MESEDKTLKLLEKTKKKTKRVIAESDLADVFGIDMEEPVVPIKKSATKRTVPGKKDESPFDIVVGVALG